MLVISDLYHALPNGDVLFSNLSFTCPRSNHITAIIGRNGIGKSTLLQCIADQVSGVSVRGSLLFYQQKSAEALQDRRVIDALGLGSYYDAYKRVEKGFPHDTDFDLLAQHWDVIERAKSWLTSADLTLALEQPMLTLSGGQRTKVRLVGLLKHAPDILLLDEPSNHLDQVGTQWLIHALKETSSQVLLISHDTSLLQSMNHFLVLSEQGITPYHMDFPKLRALLEKQRQESLKAISQTKTLLKKEQRAQQAREQKTLQRMRQGKEARKSGSQSKLLLDQKKNKAQVQSGAQKRLAQQRHQSLRTDLIQKQNLQTNVSDLPLSLSERQNGPRRVLDIINGILPYGDKTPITITLEHGERLCLGGSNGSGKSTLIRCILRQQSLCSGTLQRYGDALYLDQHLSLLEQFSSAFELFQHHVPTMEHSTIRTLLGCIDLQGDRAFQSCKNLSGGERMKVALLLISQLPSKALLILDETDNHLDLDSQAQLASILEDFQGSLIFVTHQEGWISADKVLTLHQQ